MKKNNGITMISLVITIILLLIISSVTVKVSYEAYEGIKIQNFISKLKVIQAKVDNMAEETNINNSNFQSIPEGEVTEFKAIINECSGNEFWESGDNNLENYNYFTPSNLEAQLGLKDQDLTVIINFKTRNVISKKPLKIDGKNYYRQYDLNAGEQLK